MAASTSNDKIYELIDRTRLELKSDIVRLETKFDQLETGRISRLEEQVNRQQIQQATAATKLAVVGFITSSVVGALVTSVAFKLFGVR